ncbi:MAG: hypothetical protein ACLQME_11555 [Alphaproteobacteria bacterium]
MRRTTLTPYLDNLVRLVASDRRAFPLALLLVLAFNLFWYGAFLSFPLFGEDAGALFSNLLETIKDGQLATTHFPIKWLEGLGQPNLFVTFTFDPFSWAMLLPLEQADSFRLSMALRASAGWLSSYWFVLVLFRGRRGVALTAATLYLLVDFTLMNAWGIHTFAGMYNATHAALFPLLLALALLVMRSRRWLGPADLALLVALFFFLLDYPIGSLIGTCVLLAYTVVALGLTRPAERAAAVRGLAKIVAMVAILLLAPPLHVLASWSALLQDSARTVFPGELFAYGYDYVPPVMWARTSPALRACILLCLSVLLFNRRWPRPLRMAVGTLLIVVGGVQLAALAKYLEWAPTLIDRLPRFQFFEFYATPAYAACGGFALYYWRDLLFPRLAGRRRVVSWLRGAILFFPLAVVVLPLGAVAVGTYALLAIVARARGEAQRADWTASPASQRLVARAALIALVLAAVGAWLPPTAYIYPIFYLYGRCQTGLFWCRDPAGVTMGMGDNPITRYLRRALGGEGPFAGRAETLVRPPVRFERAPAGEIKWTPELYDRLHRWYARAYDALADKGSPTGDPFWLAPQDFTWEARWPLLVALDKFGHGDVEFDGPSQEDLILEMHKWYDEEGRKFGLLARDFMDPWEGMLSVTAAVDERNAAFFGTGNGLMMRALPFQNVPVASSYEQSLGYLYYLLWTRYVSAGQRGFKSINMTSLEALHPERLALLGVRYLLARDSKVYERPPLPHVMSWNGYSIYEVPGANVAGYGVSGVEFGSTLTDELRLMRRHGFHPRDTAVLPASERTSFEGRPARAWGTLQSSAITLTPGELTFTAVASGGESFVVLPFNWSHCWQAEWRKGSGRWSRADVDLIGVAFTGEIELHLRWTAGYGSASACLRDDRKQIAEAKRAAAEIGFSQPYEPFDGRSPPFAAVRPRFAADAVEATVLELKSMYQSGDEVVVPISVKQLLSPAELDGSAWSTGVNSDFRPSTDGYELVARNEGGVSLLVLPVPYSTCWQAEWQGSPGALVPVDESWLGVLFRGAAALRLRLPAEAAQASCAQADRARERIVDLLKGDAGKIVGGRYTIGDTIKFGAGSGSEWYTTRGWWGAESWGRWSVGDDARLVLRLGAPPPGDLELDADLTALILPNRPEVRATVRVNGMKLAVWDFRADNTPGRRQAIVPRDLVADARVMIVDFRIDHVASPLELGASSDKRPLALGFRSLTVRVAGAH